MVEQASPDLILLDLMLPGMSGVEVLRRSRDKHFTGAIIIVTGSYDEELLHDAWSLHPQEVISKPIDSRNCSPSSSLCSCAASVKTPLMAYPYSGPALACVLWLISLSPPLPEPAAASDSSGSVLRHDLFVQIDPERHALVATDRFTIESRAGADDPALPCTDTAARPAGVVPFADFGGRCRAGPLL